MDETMSFLSAVDRSDLDLVRTMPAANRQRGRARAIWVLNPYGRLLLNYVPTRFETPITVNGPAADHEDAFVFRGQIDF